MRIIRLDRPSLYLLPCCSYSHPFSLSNHHTTWSSENPRARTYAGHSFRKVISFLLNGVFGVSRVGKRNVASRIRLSLTGTASYEKYAPPSVFAEPSAGTGVGEGDGKKRSKRSTARKITADYRRHEEDRREILSASSAPWCNEKIICSIKKTSCRGPVVISADSGPLIRTKHLYEAIAKSSLHAIVTS